MSDNVVHLATAGDLDREDALEVLAEVVEMAEDAQVSALAVIVVRPDGTVAVTSSRSGKAHHLVAGTVYLQQQLAGDVQ